MLLKFAFQVFLDDRRFRNTTGKNIRNYQTMLGGFVEYCIQNEVVSVDPSVFSSVKFTAASSKITKRISKRLRRALWIAVQCGLRRGKIERIKAYYDKKKKEGKPYKVVVIACANKLLHHVYAILTRGEPYRT
ncbi:hypothetical protein J2736_003394 [Paenibacillus qinlingensis]|uniref:Transposase IS116/IS110/IS902 C-terminal domain-containing protein n=1 Tax=Paenibacillus qinlingensis TaxID=1837343 RepID=A0ABU1NXG9_9BACL|nr:transposase [Paenibacillus qinlingensis]MDR6552192.1 hypothetical protein [Paenibacillus qinlingensis]